MVAHALEAAKGNRSQAARDLGLTRQGLLNKINRYKIIKKCKRSQGTASALLSGT